jgi:polyphosphate kinase
MPVQSRSRKERAALHQTSKAATVDAVAALLARAESDGLSQTELRDPALYINRELSWLEFNARVLEEAFDERNPLLERVKFLAICGSNLDEFYETRVAALLNQLATGQSFEAGRDALSPKEQLDLIHRTVQGHTALKRRLLREALIPQLARHGIHLLDYATLPGATKEELRAYFEREVFPVLTPLGVDAGRPFPHISSLSLNLLVVVRDESGDRFARIKVPPVLPRFVPVRPPVARQEPQPEPEPALTDTPSRSVPPVPPAPTVAFTYLEQVIAANLDMLFPGKNVVRAYYFRVTRNADLAIREAEAEDLLETIEESLERRLFGFVVRLEVDSDTPRATRAWLAEQLDFDPERVHINEGPLSLRDLMALTRIDRPDLKDPPFAPRMPSDWPRDGSNVLEIINRRDILLHHPYDSFAPVVDFVRSATEPAVLAIKQTLYRVGVNSPIVDGLLEARDDDTQVAVMVELKARGDEESNIGWARALEQAGVHVVYGLLGLKTHCKLALLVRKEADGLRRYAHLGTGNYNAQTARIYTDFGLFTADPDICADVSDLFNYLTGYSAQRQFRKLIVAPSNLRDQLVELIEREAAHGEHGHLIFKMNALVDSEMVETLYRAARAGVTVDLIVRGACCLRPGVPGVSDRIRVVSIIGRFLEHSRVFYFANGEKGREEGRDAIYLGSADLMPRNLNRRVEVLFPLEAPALKAQVRDYILPLLLNDNVKARMLQPDGTYQRRHPEPDEREIDAQATLLAEATAIARP